METQTAGAKRSLARLCTPQTICVFVLLAFSLPGLFWMVPSVADRMESYQPLQALKFFASHGQEFHKYGPFPNFVLAPFYGITLAIWHLRGTLHPPYGAFPYGFAHPVEQLSLLIVEGRFVFMIVCLLSAWVLVKRLARLSSSWLLVTVVAVVLLACNYCYTVILASTRPDTLMMAFGTFFVAIYIDAILDGLTLRCGVLLGLCLVAAVSSKELIYAMFVLPCGYLVLRAAFGNDPQLRSGKPLARWTALVAAATVGAYLLLNVVYAPSIWLARMRFWLSGDGIDPAIWGDSSAATLIRTGLLSALDNLGFGGAALSALAIVMLLWKRPAFSLALSLPAISFLVFAVARIHYTQVRYFMPFSIALLPVAVLGLEALRPRLSLKWHRVAFALLLSICLVPNLILGTYSWYCLKGLREVAIQRHILESPKNKTYFVFDLYPQGHGSQALSEQGYRFEDRPFQQILDSHTAWPDEILITRGEQGFILDALSDSAAYPKRADYLRKAGFTFAGFNGLEAMGYCRIATIVPSTPAWFPFNWMYGIAEIEWQETIYVYSRRCP
jgi:hypothetical protein